jgi:chromosome segregation ATPase
MKKPSRNPSVQLASVDAKIAELESHQARVNARIAAIAEECSSGKLNIGELLREKKSLTEELQLTQDELTILSQQRTELELAIANESKDAKRSELQAIVSKIEADEIPDRMARVNRLADELRRELQEFYAVVRPAANAFAELEMMRDDYDPGDWMGRSVFLGYNKTIFSLPHIALGRGNYKYVLTARDHSLNPAPPSAESTDTEAA